MAHKQVLFHSAAREKVLRGASLLADAVEAGIVDPVKVVRTALENGVSDPSVLLLTEATMTEIPEPKRERMAEPDMAM